MAVKREEGFPYLAMEFVEGQPIVRYCDVRRVDVSGRLRLFRAVCAAVRYAHGRGVVHRELKPWNILLTDSGVVKLLDFGISKVLAGGTLEATACATRSGLYLMTPEYASPEQVCGESAGPATDVYSLGIVLYELLTGLAAVPAAAARVSRNCADRLRGAADAADHGGDPGAGGR
jgi:serine/threonine protein kinase